MSYRSECPDCGRSHTVAARFCPHCGRKVEDHFSFQDEVDQDDEDVVEEYVEIEEIHPDCDLLPCRYEGCDNEQWAWGGSGDDFTICSECYDGPDISSHLPKPTVTL